MREQVFILHPRDLDQIAQSRAFSGLRAADFEGEIWLRGIPLAQDCPPVLQSLPAMARWILDESDRLFKQGQKVPSGLLPSLEWQAIADFIPFEVPVAAYAGRSHSTSEVSLVPAEQEASTSLLICQWKDLQNWAETAPAFRLEQLQWAANRNGQAALKGTLLPSLPGQAFWHFEGIHIAAGWQLENPILARHLKTACDPKNLAEVILLPEGRYESIPKTNFHACSRSGLRQITNQP